MRCWAWPCRGRFRRWKDPSAVRPNQTRRNPTILSVYLDLKSEGPTLCSYLESKLALEKAVESFGVLAAVGSVQLVVRTHDGTSFSTNRILEWPHVESVDGISVWSRSKKCGQTYSCIVLSSMLLELDWFKAPTVNVRGEMRLVSCSLPTKCLMDVMTCFCMATTDS